MLQANIHTRKDVSLQSPSSAILAGRHSKLLLEGYREIAHRAEARGVSHLRHVVLSFAQHAGCLVKLKLSEQVARGFAR